MTAPVRERLLAAVQAAVGARYGIPPPEDERDVPVTIVQDGSDDAADAYGVARLTMPLAVGRAEAAVGTSREALRAQAHAALASIVEQMHADETFGGLADGIDLVGGGIQIEFGRFVFAEASFRVRYHHLRGNPRAIDESELPVDPEPEPEP